jgi:hypothetical protein
MLVTKNELLRFVETATAGDRCIYHQGMSLGPTDATDEVRETASLAMRLWEAGKLELVQQRNCIAEFDYIAIKRSKVIPRTTATIPPSRL